MSSGFINSSLVVEREKYEKEEQDEWIDEKQAAALAKDCYNNNTDEVMGWTPIDIIDDKETGFHAKLYEKQGHYLFATAGTNPLSGKDWANNIKQHLGFEAKQYKQSIGIAQSLAKKYPGIIFVGHSLGGGLASANSRATGMPAITFNASALNNRYNLGLNSHITAYISNGDILDYVNTRILRTKVQGDIVIRNVRSSSLPNLQGIPGTGIYQLIRGIKIHCDYNL